MPLLASVSLLITSIYLTTPYIMNLDVITLSNDGDEQKLIGDHDLGKSKGKGINRKGILSTRGVYALFNFVQQRKARAEVEKKKINMNYYFILLFLVSL